MQLKIIALLISFVLLSCSESVAPVNPNDNNSREELIGDLVYNVSDSVSHLYISHPVCTECLDASVDSGTVNVPDSILQQIKIKYSSAGSNHIPSPSDLYLVGEDHIPEKLFGDSITYGTLQAKIYEVSGRVVGFKGLGLVFRVDSYKEVGIRQ